MADTTESQPSFPIFLIGFMGTGKSTVGRALGGELGLPFVDLDRVIEEDAGKSIAEIFADDGEPQFRSLETAALTRLASQGPAVVATGGGAPEHDQNLETMRRSGLVIALDASLEEVGRRIGDDASRPLWVRDESAVEELYRRRQPVYRRAHAVLRTEGRGVAETARHVGRVVSVAGRIERTYLPGTTVVALAESDYPVVVDCDLLTNCGEQIARSLGATTGVAIVSDDNVAHHYLDPLRDALRRAGVPVSCAVVVAPGERSKSLAEFGRLCQELVSAGLDRHSAVLALGGGVVGDLAGYVASSLYRGIRLLQVPTSLLAMVDSAIGGKTGINLESGKNLVGSFWQPELVLADPDVLATLPRRERRAAYGELLKYGLLDGDELLVEIEELAPALGGETWPPGEEHRNRLARVIRRCASYKAWVVGVDEREVSGERALLNLGHTVGHAIEAASGFEEVVHGEAVGLGLIAAARISHRLGLAAVDLEPRVRDAMLRAGLDTDLERYLRAEVLERAKVDKKRTGARIGFIAISEPGKCSKVLLEADELFRTLRA